MWVAFAAGVLAVLSGQAAAGRLTGPRDPFVAQRDAAAALNPLSARFTIALEGNRTTFRMGERIPLVFTYDNLGRRSRDAVNRTYLHFAEAVLDRPGGAARPFDGFLRSGLAVPGGVCCGVPGGVVSGGPTLFGGIAFDAEGRPFMLPNARVPPPPPPPPPPPVSMTFVLNEGIRFDAPGKYRLYMADRHGADYVYGPGRTAPSPLISNIVEFEITGRDEAWETETLRSAVAVLDGSSDSRARTEAADTVRFLALRAAVDVMVGRPSHRSGGAYRGVDSRGLFGARDRDYAIAMLARRVDDAFDPMSRFDLRTLAALRIIRSPAGTVTVRDQHQAMLAVAARRLRALARAGVLADRLRATFEAQTADDLPVGLAVPVTPALASYASEVEAVLTKLTPDQQEAVLFSHSSTFSETAGFRPMLRRLAAKGSRLARGFVTDLTAPSETPPPLDRVDATIDSVSCIYNPDTKRRVYVAGGLHVSFVELGSVFSRLPRGTALEWYDGLEDIWELDRDAEFRRVERVARRHGLTLTRR